MLWGTSGETDSISGAKSKGEGGFKTSWLTSRLSGPRECLPLHICFSRLSSSEIQYSEYYTVAISQRQDDKRVKRSINGHSYVVNQWMRTYLEGRYCRPEMRHCQCPALPSRSPGETAGGIVCCLRLE